MCLTNRARGSLLLHLSPLLLPFLAVIGGGITYTLLGSFGLVRVIGAPEFTLEAYARIFNSPFFISSFFFSLSIAFFSGLTSLLLGLLLALGIWRASGWLLKLAGVYKIPLVLPHISVAFLILLLFSQSGIVSSWAYTLGLIDSFQEFPRLVFGKRGTAIYLAYVYKEMPFITLMVYGVLQRFDYRHIQTAKMLGASTGRAYFTVLLPHLFPVLNTSFIIVFLFSFGAFDIPYLLSSSRPRMLSITVYNLFFQHDFSSRPEALAMLSLMFLFSALFIALYARVAEKLDTKVRAL